MSIELELIYQAENALCDKRFTSCHSMLVLFLVASQDHPNKNVHRCLAQALYEADTKQVPAALRSLKKLRSFYAL